MVKVEIYSTRVCPYCVRAKALLMEKGVEFTEYMIDVDHEKQAEMMQRQDRTSVPQIFINDHHVGGCDDLYELEEQGKLDPLLKDN